MLTEQKNETAKLFQFTATTSNPWDEVQFNFGKHKGTNMVLRAIRLTLNDDAKTDVNKLLFSTGDHNNVTVSSGDKRNISGRLICHPILLNSPFVEPAGIDKLLDDLLLERHPYTVLQANDGSGSYEADKAYIKLATLKNAALLALRNVYQVASHTFHVYLWDLTGIFYLALGKMHPTFSHKRGKVGISTWCRQSRLKLQGLNSAHIRQRTLLLSSTNTS